MYVIFVIGLSPLGLISEFHGSLSFKRLCQRVDTHIFVSCSMLQAVRVDGAILHAAHQHAHTVVPRAGDHGAALDPPPPTHTRRARWFQPLVVQQPWEP